MAQRNSARWDLGRFLKTLFYFEVIPCLGSIDWLQRLLASRPGLMDSSAMAVGEAARVSSPNSRPSDLSQSDVTSGTPSANIKTEVVLVAGATGGVGKRVVRRLVERGYRVRALVRDAERARALLGDNVEMIEADITIPETLTPALMSNLKAVVCCTGTRVQPIGGDTPNREKYYQGIKFYLPEVVDTPELVEYQGVQNLVQAAAQDLSKAREKPIWDFQNPLNDLRDWGAVDDVVMGGVSESKIRPTGSAALFAGNVSTANAGGFASVRTRNFNSPLSLAGYDGVELCLRGDGKRYKFMLRTDPKWDGVAYCHSFDTVANAWIKVRIPFADLLPVFRAKTVNADSVDLSHICAFQLMHSKFEYDDGLNPTFTPGAFQLEVESLKAYKNMTSPQFVMVSSAGVTRPDRSDINLEEEPPAVKMNEQLGGILTWKLRAEECVRESGLLYTIIRPCALTEELGGETLIAAQGDNLKGKVSREDIAELCVQALEHPQACNITFEVAAEQNGSSSNWACFFANLQPDVACAVEIVTANEE